MLNKSIIKELILNERNNLPSVLTPSDLIDLLPFGRSKIYEMIRTGEIPAKKVGGSIIIQRDIFLMWLYNIEKPESLEELKLN